MIAASASEKTGRYRTGGGRLPVGKGEGALRRAIEQCLVENWTRLYGYALSLCGDRETARDLVQSSATNALASSSPPRDVAAIRAWLFRIVRNAWIDHCRRRSVRQNADLPAEAITGSHWSFDDRILAGLTVQQGLARIDPLHREVIELVDIAGFRYAEAAVILDIPVGTVMSRLSRARLALLEAVEGGSLRPLAAGRRTL